MNVVSAQALLVQIGLWVFAAIGIAVTATYFLRPKVRARYPGGARRYLVAVATQAAGFMLPIPVVLIALIGTPIPAGVDVLMAAAAGVLTVLVLRSIPVTGPLLRDLARTRLELALERLAGKS